jgi:ribosomal protein L40E
MSEAFHRTFNFCMTCRQYACDKCWNPQQGACLTCAPEAGLGPVEPEDHLIVRTPVARGDNDWALFPDILGNAGEPAAEAPPSLSAWPVQDLRVSAREADSGSAGSHERLVRPSEDREAWNVWPIADEIAPEMTLTPAEMVIIEAQLAQEEAAEGPSAVHEAAPLEVLPDLPEVEPWVLPSPMADEPAQPVESLSPMEGEQPDQATGPEAAQLEEQVVEPVFAEMAPPPSPTPAEEQVVEPVSAEMAPPPSPTPAEEQVVEPVSAEMAPPPSPTPAEEQVVESVLAEMAPPPSPTPAEERVPAIARFLGRFSLRGGSSLRRPASAPAPRPSEPGNASWPHATEWSRRPIQAHDWSSDASPTVVEPEIAQVDETYAAATVAPQPFEPEIAQVDETYTAATVAPQPFEPEIAQVDETYAAATVAPQPFEPEIAQVDETYAAATVAPQPFEPEAVLATSAAEPSDEVSSAAEPVADAERSGDFVEPLRVAAMPPVPPLPFYEPTPIAAGQQTLFDAAPASDFTTEHGLESAAQPDAHPEVAEVAPEPAPPLATPSPAPPLAAASPTVPMEAPPLYRAPRAPAAWPPIGASWPARETPGAPWLGPEAPSVPAAMVAREASLPVLAGMWAQSAQEVLSRGSVRVCHRCALPVSTQARFCRRCGTKQA